MQQLLDRFVFRIGPTTVAFVKSMDDDRLWCAHTMRQSSFRRLCVQQKTKIAWCVPGFILHCDNRSGQNKNKYMMWYMMWRVIHGLHDNISVNFMISGNTKFAPDWSFGLLKQNFRRMEVHCLDDMARAVSESAQTLNRPQLVGREDGTVIVPTYNWQTFLSPYFRKVDGIKSLHHFIFQAGSTAVTMRATEGEEQSFQIQLLKDPDQLPPITLPAPIIPPGLSKERQKYLRDNIRQFVRAKDILCP